MIKEDCLSLKCMVCLGIIDVVLDLHKECKNTGVMQNLECLQRCQEYPHVGSVCQSSVIKPEFEYIFAHFCTYG